MLTQPKNLEELYQGADLPVLFKGGFINFGFWESAFNSCAITTDDVITANENLYKKVFEKLEISPQDKILEIGSGYGGGCVLAKKNYNFKSLVGVDYFTRHIKKSLELHSKYVAENMLSFRQGNAEKLPFAKQSIDKIYSLEAFQHFQPQPAISEFARVLRKNGILVIATFFILKKEYFSKTLTLLPRPAVLADQSSHEESALPEVLFYLKANFTDLELISIGEKVWFGFDKWVKQNDPDIWDKNWLLAYQEGLLDYFIIKAKRK